MQNISKFVGFAVELYGKMSLFGPKDTKYTTSHKIYIQTDIGYLIGPFPTEGPKLAIGIYYQR